MTRRVASITMDENGIYIDDTLHVTGDMFIESNFNLMNVDANITAGFIEVSHTLTANTLVVTRIDEIDPGQGIEIIGNVILDESNYLFGNIGSLNLHILGNTYIRKDLTVVGETTFCANVDVKGNKLSSNVIHVNDIHSNGVSWIAVHSALSPAVTGSYDLSSATTKWNTLYIDQDVSVGNALLFDSVTSGIQINGVASAVSAIAIGKGSSASANYSIAIGDLAHAYVADDIQLGRNVGSTGTGILRFHGQTVSDESWIGGGTDVAYINSDGNIMKGGIFLMSGNLDMSNYSIINAGSVAAEQLVVGNLSGNSLVTINDHAVSFSNAAVFETSGTESMRLLDSATGNFTFRTGSSSVAESPAFTFSPSAAQLIGGYISIAAPPGPAVVTQWIKQSALFNTTGSDGAIQVAENDITVDNNGNVFMTFSTTGVVSGGTDLAGATREIVITKLSATGTHLWNRQIEPINTSAGSESLPSINVDDAGNIYIVYSTSGTVSGGTNIGNDDIVAAKLDTNGTVLWIRQQAVYNTTGSDRFATSAVNKSTGDLYITYSTTFTISGGTNIGSYDIAVFKIDTNGTFVWSKQSPMFNSTGSDYTPVSTRGLNIAVDTSGNAYITTYTSGTISGGTQLGSGDIMVFKLDTNGTHLWNRQQSTFNTTTFDEYPDIAVDSSGNVFVAYNSYGTVSGGTASGSSNIVVFKLDTNGNHLWNLQNSFFNSGFEGGAVVDIDSSGNLYVAYETGGTVSGGTNIGAQDIVVTRIDTNGTLLSTNQVSSWNTSATDGVLSLAVNGDNAHISYTTNGTVSGGTNRGSNDMVVAKLARAQSTSTLTIGTTGVTGTDLSAIVGNPYVGLTFRCIVKVTTSNLLAISGTPGTAVNGITPYGDTAASNYPRDLVFINTGTNTWNMLINGRMTTNVSGYPPIGVAGGAFAGTYPNPTINAPTALGFGGSSLIRSYEGAVGNGWNPTSRFEQVITVSAGFMRFTRFVPIVDMTITQLYAIAGSAGLTVTASGQTSIFDADGNKLVEGTIANAVYGARVLLGGTFTTGGGYPSSIAVTAGQKYWAGLLVGTGSGGVYGDTNVSFNISWLSTNIQNNWQIYCSSTGGGYSAFPASCVGIAFTQQDSGFSFLFK